MYLGAIAKSWLQWLESDGASGEEPSKEIQDLYAKWKRMKNVDDDTRLEIAEELFAFQARNVYSMGTVARTIRPLVVSNRLKNVPQQGMWAFDWLGQRQAWPEQFYLDE